MAATCVWLVLRRIGAGVGTEAGTMLPSAGVATATATVTSAASFLQPRAKARTFVN